VIIVNRTAGRPQKYSYEVLKENLVEYLKTNKSGKVNYTNLSKYSGIPYHIWRDNKEINNDITKANDFNVHILGISDEINILPNICEIIENNYSNKDKLIAALRHYNNTFEELIKKCNSVEQLEVDNYKLKQEINTLKVKKEQYIKELNSKKESINKIAISYNSIKKCREMKIKKDVLDNEARNSKSVSSNVNDLKAIYPELFF